MDAASLPLLESLLNAPGPSGYERPIQEVVRRHASTFSEIKTDWHGNVTCAVNPGGTPRVLLAGHCDQIGLIVKHIDDKGFLRCSPVGGWDIQQLIGQQMEVWTANGPVPGVIARKAIHLLSDEERNKVPKIKDLFIDIGTKGRAEASEVVRIGDPVTVKLGMRKLRGDLVTGPGMDDRVGLWVVLEAARIIAGAPEDFDLYSGDDGLTLSLLAVGAVGVVGVATHWTAGLHAEMIAAHDKGDGHTAAEINRRLGPSFAVETGPTWVHTSAAKAALEALGQPGGALRLPLPPLDDDVRRAVRRVLDDLGLAARG